MKDMRDGVGHPFEGCMSDFSDRIADTTWLALDVIGAITSESNLPGLELGLAGAQS